MNFSQTLFTVKKVMRVKSLRFDIVCRMPLILSRIAHYSTVAHKNFPRIASLVACSWVVQYYCILVLPVINSSTVPGTDAM
jgi:hypothetical protein